MAVSTNAKIRIAADVKGQQQLQAFSQSTEQLQGRVANLSGKMATAALKAGALALGFAGVGRAIGGALRVALDFEDWVGKMTPELEAMRKASAGIIDVLTLQKGRLQLVNGEFQTSEAAMQSLSKAAIHLARRTGGDAKQAFDELIKAIVTGRPDKLFRQMGFDVEFLGTKSEKSNNALKLLAKKFGDIEIKAANTNERLAQLKNSLSDSVAEFGSAITSSGAFGKAMESISGSISGAAKMIRMLTSDTAKARAEALRWHRTNLTVMGAQIDSLGWLGRVASGPLRGVIDDALRSMKEAQKVADAAEKRESERERKKKTKPLATGQIGGKKKIGGKKSGPYDWSKGAILGGDYINEESLDDADLEMDKDRDSAWGQVWKEQAELAMDATKPLTAAQQKMIENNVKMEESIKSMSNAMRDMGLSALSDFAGGIWDAADAALLGEQSFGKAMAEMTKKALLGIAKQASVRATFEYAAYAASAFTAQHHLIAGLGFTAAAAATGGAGLALSAAGVGKKDEKARSASERQQSGFRPSASFGAKKSREQQKVIVNVYLGEKDNPAAAYILRKQVAASLAAA